MTSYKLLAATAALALVPFSAQAQTVSAVATIGYDMTNITGIDQGLDTTSISTRASLDMGNGLSFGLNLTGIAVGIDGVPIDISALMFGVDANYRFANGFSVGTYIENATITTNMLPYDLAVKSYGVKFGYETGNLDLGGFAGISETSPDVGFMGIDIRDVGVQAHYAISPRAMVGGSFVRTAISAPGTSADVDTLGIAGAYAFNDSWSMFAGVSQTSVDLLSGDNLTTFGIGASYDLSGVLHTPASLSLELARTQISGVSEKMDTVRLGITFPYGNASALPLNSVAGAVLHPRGNAVVNTLLVAF